jgi:3-deoxy-D-manno-octulosonic-acid transferase
MHILYDLIFMIFAIVQLPVYLFKGKLKKSFLLRLGFLPRDLNLERPIWIHAVSVGEAQAVKGLLDELRKVYPNKKFVISTVTATGNKIVRGFSRKGDFVTYLPLDLSFIVRRVVAKVDPSLFIIAETEIWPNIISALNQKHIPIILVNGRISDASLRGYKAIKFLLKDTLSKINACCVQSERDALRFKEIGVGGDRVKVTGNMKFDAASLNLDNRKQNKLRSELWLGQDDKFLVCGSTHAGEEETILKEYKKLLGNFKNLKLLIAPRHPERSREVSGLVLKYGFESVMVSALPAQAGIRANAVFILDTVGSLIDFYEVADIVFVGGSLAHKGGHNILEPASFSKPIIFGPYMFNFRDIADLFISNNAAVMLRDGSGLSGAISKFLNDPDEARQTGQRGRQLISLNIGATLRNVEVIKLVMPGR